MSTPIIDPFTIVQGERNQLFRALMDLILQLNTEGCPPAVEPALQRAEALVAKLIAGAA